MRGHHILDLVAFAACCLIGARAARPGDHLHGEELDQVLLAETNGREASQEDHHASLAELVHSDGEHARENATDGASVSSRASKTEPSGDERESDSVIHVGSAGQFVWQRDVGRTASRESRELNAHAEVATAAAMTQVVETHLQSPVEDAISDDRWKLEDKYHTNPAVCEAGEVKESQTWHSQWVSTWSKTQKMRDQIADDCKALEKYRTKAETLEEDITTELNELGDLTKQIESMTEELGIHDGEILVLYRDTTAKENAAEQAIKETADTRHSDSIFR